MFTIRFMKHDGSQHMNYSCSRYGVERQYERGDGTACAQVMMVDEKDNVTYEQVGPREPYGIAYVTNAAGKTIDKIVAKSE